MLPDFHNAGYIHEPQDSAQLFHFYDARTKLIRLDFYENNSSDISKKNHFWTWEDKKMLKFLLKYEIVDNKVYNTVSVRSLMPIIQHTLYNAISQKPLQEAGGGRKILELFLPI